MHPVKICILRSCHKWTIHRTKIQAHHLSPPPHHYIFLPVHVPILVKDATQSFTLQKPECHLSCPPFIFSLMESIFLKLLHLPPFLHPTDSKGVSSLSLHTWSPSTSPKCSLTIGLTCPPNFPQSHSNLSPCESREPLNSWHYCSLPFRKNSKLLPEEPCIICRWSYSAPPLNTFYSLLSESIYSPLSTTSCY